MGFKTSQEIHEGNTVLIYAPFSGRLLDILFVTEVIGNNYLHGTSETSGIETTYCLSDGIRVVVRE